MQNDECIMQNEEMKSSRLRSAFCIHHSAFSYGGLNR